MLETSDGSPIDVHAVLLAESVTAGSLEAMRCGVRESGQRCGLDGLPLAQFVLVVHELVVNAIRHGGGLAWAVVWRDAAGLHCAVTDRGGGIPRRYLDPERGTPDGEIPRYGLRLVRQICRDIRLDTGSHGTYIEIGYAVGAAVVRGPSGG